MIGHAMAFNLSDYQTVAERLDEALKEHGDMRVITSLEHTERIDGRPLQYVMKAEIWLGTTLVSTGWAEEIVGNSPVNKTSALENCETSAIGRALANFGFQGKKPAETRPTRNEMEKVERVRRAEQEQVKQAKPLDWGEPDLLSPLADNPFASWNLTEALGAEVIETKPVKVSDDPGNGGAPVTDKQQKMIRAKYAEKFPDGDLAAFVAEVIKSRDISHLSELTKWEASMVIDRLMKG
jgi:hypothetical protein